MVKESICNAEAAGDVGLILGQEDILDEDTSPVFLPRESFEPRRLAGYSAQGHKESLTTEVT